MELSLRSWTLDDLDTLVKYAGNPAIAKNMMDSFPHPYGPEQGRNFIAFATRLTPNNILAVDIGGAPVGSIGLHPLHDIECRNAELGYWLAEPFWGQGIMTRALRLMIDYGFKHWDIDRIFARPFGTNIGSQKALEKAGFILEARFEATFFKNGEYQDELVYAVRRK